MSNQSATPPFAAKARVKASIDLPGIPAGTEGVVVMVVGIEWLRCRVRFDNGVERGMLDAAHLEAV